MDNVTTNPTEDWGEIYNDYYGVEAEEQTNDQLDDKSGEEFSGEVNKPEIVEENRDSETSEEDTKETEPEAESDKEVQEVDPPQEQQTSNLNEYYKGFAEYKENLKSEILSSFEPINVGLTDERTGRPIEDYTELVGRYENPETGEPFNEEEAAAYFLEKNKEIAQISEERHKEAELYSDNTLQFQNNLGDLNRKYGEFLNNHEDLKNQLIDNYIKTITLDDSQRYIKNMPIDMLDFYDFHLKPYLELDSVKKEQEKLKEQLTLKESESKRQYEQADRGDILLGVDTVKRGAKSDGWQELLDEYYSDY